MARTYYVQRAQQRYATKPVLDPATGDQKVSPKMRRGVQMKDKRGNPIFMKVTERDLSRPLPMPKCSKCGTVIEPGQPYKYTEAYQRTIIRCGPCPAPQQWEYSSSVSARVAEIVYNAENILRGATDRESIEAAQNEIAGEVRALAEEKQEAAQNMEDGFGHETSQSSELRDIGEQLETWADEIECADLPEDPEPENEECPECEATGEVGCSNCDGSGIVPEEEGPCPCCDGGGQATCDNCNGACEIPGEEPTSEQWDEWVDEARSVLEDVLGACPL